MGELDEQADQVSFVNGAPSLISSITKKKRQPVVGGPMTAEEARLNKSLL